MPGHNLPYTLDMYKAQLQKMMNNPMAQGQPPAPAQQNVMDRLRAAATSLVANTAIAGSTLG